MNDGGSEHCSADAAPAPGDPSRARAFGEFIRTQAGKPLDAAYGVIVDGFGAFPGSRAIAKYHRGRSGTRHERAHALLRSQCVLAGSAGFLTGLGGYASIAVSVPAAAVLQAMTVAAIAELAGHDPLNPEVKSIVLMIIAGDSVIAPAKRAATSTGKSFAIKAITRIPRGVLSAINRSAGSRLVTKAGTKGAINLTKAVPVLGGIIGGVVDIVTLQAIGRHAIRRFIDGETPRSDPSA